MFRRGNQNALSDVYVEVRCTSELARDPGGWWHDRGTQVLGRFSDHRIRLNEVLALEHKRWALLGDPGSGKTTLLHQLGLELLDKPDGPLPVLFRVAKLEAGDTLASVLQGRYPSSAQAILGRFERGQAVLLLDGLDEHLDRQLAEDVLNRLATEAGDCTVILSNRPIGYQPPSANYEELRLCPLERAAQEALLGRWVSDAVKVRDTLDRMGRRRRLQRLAENPMLLTLVGLVLQEGGEVPERRSKLYKLAVGNRADQT